LELSVDVSHDLDRGFKLEQDGLRQEYLPSHQANSLDLVFGELDILACLLGYESGDD
jgi:hypothetical protein